MMNHLFAFVLFKLLCSFMYGFENFHQIPISSYQLNKKCFIENPLLFLSAAAAATAGSLLSPRRSYAATDTCVCDSPNCKRCISRNNNENDFNKFLPFNERIYDTLHQSFIPAFPEKFLHDDLRGKKIIAIGEIHSNPFHHKLEFEIIRAVMKERAPKYMAIGLESFYRQHQPALDRYIFLHKDFARLKFETNWDNTWGYDLNYYAKIFNFAAIHGIRLIGLNLPIQLAKLVSEVGYDSLPSDLKDVLPELDLSVEKHKQLFLSSMRSGGHVNLDDHSVDLMYQTQTLWDEYMAESAANYIEKYPESTLIVIAGVGHIQGRVAIPDRIQKRTKKYPFVIVPQQVEWSLETGLPLVNRPLSHADCDWAWYTERETRLA